MTYPYNVQSPHGIQMFFGGYNSVGSPTSPPSPYGSPTQPAPSPVFPPVPQGPHGQLPHLPQHPSFPYLPQQQQQPVGQHPPQTQPQSARQVPHSQRYNNVKESLQAKMYRSPSRDDSGRYGTYVEPIAALREGQRRSERRRQSGSSDAASESSSHTRIGRSPQARPNGMADTTAGNGAANRQRLRSFELNNDDDDIPVATQQIEEARRQQAAMQAQEDEARRQEADTFTAAFNETPESSVAAATEDYYRPSYV
ncbi:MAG: hypothetical protein Q9166_007936 [cf. Caloplaca sp. 2 TL-2023]